MAAKPFDLPPLSAVPLVGREKERETLTKALADARVARGQTWLVEGAAGIGKTRLVRWLEEDAIKKGFRVSWGYCLKESNLPFFPFQQIFRHSGTDATAQSTPAHIDVDDTLPLLTIFENERPIRLLERVAALSSSRPCLVVSRERPDHLKKQFPSLAPAAHVLQLTKGGEGEDCLPPGQVDAIGERLSQHLKSGQGAVVALTSLDYLVSQNGFPPVLRLVQFLREEAERADAHVLFSVNPATLEKREMALLEGEGDVVREAAPQPAAAAPSGPEPPATTMLRYLDVLEREAPQQPRLLVVDDVQWADPDSLRTLQFLARNIRSLPVLLVGTIRAKEWRTTEDSTDQVLDDILGKIDEEGLLFRLPLGGLGDDESQDLIERTIGLPLQKGDGGSENSLLSIFKRAEGNPYFVQETMRQLAQQGLLRREGDHAVLAYQSAGGGESTGEGAPIPPTLRRLVARRLSMLTRDETDLLRWASITGSEFELPPLVAALHRPGVEVLALLHRLERDLHIIEGHPGGERWSFGHPLVWEVALSETDAEERRQKALMLADWWAEHRVDDVGTVARLYYDAREPGRGLPWVRKAIDMAISRHASETVERYHHWLQDLLHAAGADPRNRVKEGMSVCERHLLEIGSGPALSHMIEFLISLPNTPEEHLSARILLAYSLCSTDARRAQALMDTVNSEMVREHGRLSPKWRVIAAVTNADALYRQGKYRAEIDELQRQTSVVAEVEEPWVKGRVAFDRGFSCASIGLVAEAKDALAELRRLAPTSGLPLLEGWSSELDAAIANLEGDLRQYERCEALALDFARSRGDIRGTSASLGNLAVSDAFRGKFDEARAYLLEDQKICNRFGLRDQVDFAILGECIILWGEQRWAELVQRLTEFLSRPVGDEAGRALTYSFLAEGHTELGDLSSARTCIVKVEERREELSPGEFANLMRVRARVEEAEGDPEAARKTISDALLLLEAHPNMHWGAWLNAEMARWESKHGDPARASSLRAEAEFLFERSGVLPAGRPKWLRDFDSQAGRTRTDKP